MIEYKFTIKELDVLLAQYKSSEIGVIPIIWNNGHISFYKTSFLSSYQQRKWEDAVRSKGGIPIYSFIDWIEEQKNKLS